MAHPAGPSADDMSFAPAPMPSLDPTPRSPQEAADFERWKESMEASRIRIKDRIYKKNAKKTICQLVEDSTLQES